MRILQTLSLITFIALHTTAARRRPRPNPVMGALHNIFSPANTERTMRMVNLATQQTPGNTIIPLKQPMPIQYSPPVLPPEPCNIPVNQISIPQNPPKPLPCPVPVPTVPPCQTPNQIPHQPSVQIPIQTPVQLPIQLPLQLPVQIPNPPVKISNMPIQVSTSLAPVAPRMPEITMPVGPRMPEIAVPVGPRMPEIVMPEKSCVCQRELVYPDPLPNCYCSPTLPPIANLSPETTVPVALTSIQDTYGYPLPSPAALFNPFLPAASPVSAWTSENIPTACSGAKSQYLRKIPIPPPTL